MLLKIEALGLKGKKISKIYNWIKNDEDHFINSTIIDGCLSSTHRQPQTEESGFAVSNQQCAVTNPIPVCDLSQAKWQCRPPWEQPNIPDLYRLQ